MNEHVTPERIVAWVDGELAGEEHAAVERHLAACERCRSDAQDLGELDEKVMRAGESAGQHPGPMIPAAMRSELEATARALLASRSAGTAGTAGIEASGGSTIPAGTRRRLVLRMLPALAAAILIVAVFLFAYRDQAGRPAFASIEVETWESGGTVRGTGERRFHLALVPGRKTWLTVLRLDAQGDVAFLFPSPNPVFGDFGLDGPFEPGSQLRIPPDPLLDFAVPGAGEQEFVFVVPSELPLAPEDRARLLAELQSIASPGQRGAAGHEAKAAELASFLRPRFPGTELRAVR